MSTGCKSKPAEEPGVNVILISIDTLRADHLSCYGYYRRTSPAIDRAAAGGVLFSHAYSTASWTAPAVASIFTGLYPRSHGVIHGVAGGPNAAIQGQEKLDAKFLTLAEALKREGYTTYGISSNGHLSRGTGFSQGFDRFIAHWFQESPAQNDTLKKWVSHIRQSSKYFLWVHYFDPHNPYSPRMPWIKSYTLQSGSYSQWTREVMANPKEYIDDIRKDTRALNTLVDRYDSEINFCDNQIHELLELLKPEPNTLIIITSDHGEAFLDHGQLLHGDTLYDEELRVPLIIRFPGTGKSVRPGVVDQPVSNGNIFATVMDIVGKKKTKASIPGQSLMPLARGVPGQKTGFIYHELDWGNFGYAVRFDKWKLIIMGREQGVKSLFDLASDSSESRDQAGINPQKLRFLEDALNRWINANPLFIAPKINIVLDMEQEEKLKSLGYIK